MTGEYYIEYSKAKMGWCVYRRHVANSSSRGPKEAGPYRDRSDAKKERDRLNELT